MKNACEVQVNKLVAFRAYNIVCSIDTTNTKNMKIKHLNYDMITLVNYFKRLLKNCDAGK